MQKAFYDFHLNLIKIIYMKYKVVQFPSNEDVVGQLQSIIDQETANGYNYISHEYSDKLRPGTSGCFGLGAKPDTVKHIGFIVFQKV